MEQLRQNAELDQSLGGGFGGPGGAGGGQEEADPEAAVPEAAVLVAEVEEVSAVAAEVAAAGVAVAGVGGGGFGGGGFGNFRNFKPNQPHGAFFWTGGNSALNANPFPIRGEAQQQPSYAQNQFGLTFMGAPYIPHLIEHDTKDVIFFNLSGQRSSSPFNQYGTVPTAAERDGDLSGLTSQQGAPITIYDPATGQPFPNNTIPAARISQPGNCAAKLLPAAQPAGTVSELPAPYLGRIQHHPARCAFSAQLRQQLGRLADRWADPPVSRTGRRRHPPEHECELQLQSRGGR